MSTARRPSLHRWLAVAAAAIVVGAGAVTVETTVAPPAHAAYPGTFNPFSMSGGFTVYAREDALLQNQETEGSIAVGGVSTVQGSSGQYTIIHVAAGTGDYTLPTVDGDPTRYLVGSHSPDSTNILAVTSAGTSDPALWGDVKMVQRDGPWQAFGRADWIRLNENPSNADQTPLIDATHQTYPASAAPPSGPAGNTSVYTANTGPTAVADYVEANAEASYDDAASCLDGLSTVGNPVGVAEDAGSRVVLDPLSPDQPNVVDYADIAGTALIQYSPGPTPGAANPLIIRVPAGTTTVIGARSDPQGEYSPYILWDLSALTGDVAVTAAEARIDGSIYAPEASVTVTAAPLDGQVLGREVTIRGGEVHSFFFAGEISCEADSGTFAVSKAIDGIDEEDVPAGTTFTVNYTATAPDGTVSVGTLEVPADGSAVAAGEQFAIGTSVQFEEVQPESIPGYEWGTATISPNPLIVGAGSAEVVVTNTATELTGTFSVAKTTEDPFGGTPGAPSAASVPVDWVATLGSEEIGAGTLDVPFDGTRVEVGQDFPLGTRVTLTEDRTGIDPPDGYVWTRATWDPGSTIIIGEDDESIAVTLTNTVVPIPDEEDRLITIAKSVEGAAADPAFAYAVSYNTDTAGTRTTRALDVGRPVLLDDVAQDVAVLDLAELLPTFNGDPVDPALFEVPVIEVTAGGTTTEYRPENFEGAGPLATAIVEIPLPPTGIIGITVRNTLQQGTFELSKEFEGIDDDDLPGLEFTVGWTAVTPTGDVQTGTVRLPADGTPVTPVDAAGDPLLFPFGTTISFDEQEAPRVRSVQWLEATFDPEQLVIGEGGAATVSSTLTNTADTLVGTFAVAKDLAGIDADELLTDSFAVDYTAWEPDRTVTAGRFEIPADGTPTEPTRPDGTPIEFPVGTIVRLFEEEPDPDALPPGFAWAESTWSPGNTLTIRGDQTAVLHVTNNVQELTRWAITKTVEGDGAATIPTDTAFPVDWWWDYDPQNPVELEQDVVLISPWFPVNSIIEAREQALPDIPGVEWGTPVWTVDGEVLVPDDEGKVVLPMTATHDEDDIARLTLVNTADRAPTPTPTPTPEEGAGGVLPTTGGTGVVPIVPVLAAAMILLGLALTIRRRRQSA
ncbi:DUF5979 domain-containing protein [Microbacterium terricola]|uniref:Choice-of-anchor A family protein n=1 Tax=Microbacterium terricola TaxID=344163 RepID=A0ABM8E2J9_9MICO|nr:DUF5979 domain-containing protein [Microbacterium terricola]UYK40104.1 DUF5979 domain-containing protein [Microbacterium terricola]BDV32194.1 hypothetical protein Microterr_28540 [Microbacterium terricola]